MLNLLKKKLLKIYKMKNKWIKDTTLKEESNLYSFLIFLQNFIINRFS